MDIVLASIGYMKKSPELDLITKYIKQTRFQITIKEFEDKKSGSSLEKKQREGELLLCAVPNGSKIIVLDERGKTMTSMDFASYLGKQQDAGVPAITFLIGGADGHTDEVRAKADLILSFGAMTLPHLLARVVLVEQIYRAKTILDGHPYHRE